MTKHKPLAAPVTPTDVVGWLADVEEQYDVITSIRCFVEHTDRGNPYLMVSVVVAFPDRGILQPFYISEDTRCALGGKDELGAILLRTAASASRLVACDKRSQYWLRSAT